VSFPGLKKDFDQKRWYYYEKEGKGVCAAA